MVQLKEFRIVMPMSLEEYQVAQAFMVMKMQQQSTSSTEGVDVLESRPFHDSVLGAGHYTSKVYRLQSKAPGWLTAFAPKDALILQEEAWNAYPRCKTGFLFTRSPMSYVTSTFSISMLTFFCRLKLNPRRTVVKCPYFTKFSLTIDTIHKADNGKSENVHGLSKQQLAARQVEPIDIATAATDYWSYAVGSNNTDFSDFRSEQTGRGPLCEGWQEKFSPIMTAYKLVTVNAPYWGFGNKLEQALLAGERALFLGSHQNCFAWIDEWFGLTMEQIRELERQCKPSQDEKVHNNKDPFNRTQLNSEQHGYPLVVSEGS